MTPSDLPDLLRDCIHCSRRCFPIYTSRGPVCTSCFNDGRKPGWMGFPRHRSPASSTNDLREGEDQ